MAGELIRNASFYFKGKKVATCSGYTYTVSSNNEDQIGDGAWLGTTDGVNTSKLNTNCIVPVKGVGVDILTSMLAKKYVKIGLGIVDGKIHKVNMKIMNAEYETDMARGSLTGRFEFSGGEPNLAG